jgi:hypothetical protein
VTVGDGASARTFASEPSDEESTAVTVQDVNCDPSRGENRNIVSELHAWVQFCVVYGQNEHPINGSWMRSIWMTWDYFPGWNSAQSQINSQPSEGTPTIQGTVSSRKQNGILPPTVISTSLWENAGHGTTWGWTVGGLTSGGRFSLAINDIEVTDPDFGYSHYIGSEATGQRFECDTEQERCYFPNGEEAPV